MNRETGWDCCSLASISGPCNLWSATPLRWFSLVTASVGCRPPNVGRDVCSATICPPYTESRVSNGAQLYARSPVSTQRSWLSRGWKKLNAFIPFPRTLLGIWRAHQLPVHRAKTISHALSAICSFGDRGYFHSALLPLSTNHFSTISLSTLSIYRVPFGYGSDFWITASCPSFLPRASDKFEKRVYTRGRAHTHTHASVFHKACIRCWLASQAVWICEELGGKRSLSERTDVWNELSRTCQFLPSSLFPLPLSVYISFLFLSPFFSSISIFTTYAFHLFFFLRQLLSSQYNINRNNQVCEVIF